eukprot:CAMPEP_0119434012 /NCGR_PEP_ID=MMETSP1335-20130426/50455_1 /TAXON_ID=259385 /ORGANISM="Chrysoculter rhomboideus, Strain RCC1486" /LENGTH=155 /DNA_ID=CAMNT_0007459863 /DNA_START=486 /DNA_END=953 /DNA_ORIENTATION=-
MLAVSIAVDAQIVPTCLLGTGNKSANCAHGSNTIPCQPGPTPAISSSGSWNLHEDYKYYLDRGLAAGIGRLVGAGGSISEFGAGKGCYTYAFRSMGISVAAYDGSPQAGALTGGLVHTLDMTSPSAKEAAKISDWVLYFALKLWNTSRRSSSRWP